MKKEAVASFPSYRKTLLLIHHKIKIRRCMMETMITEKTITFKELEKKIYKEICNAGCQALAAFLEEYDKELRDKRDKTVYCNKGRRATTIKTVMGEVTFSRTLYRAKGDDGITHSVYLLDETLGLRRIGLFSENYAEKLVSGITTKSYRDCAKEVSETTGQSVSAMGVWNAVQKMGEKVCREEELLVEKHRKGQLQGELEPPVLFEESDGVNISIQRESKERNKGVKAEMKVAIAYDGWKKDSNERYRLNNKVAFAGFAEARDFHRIREAKINQIYNTDEIKHRILNGDGAAWIKNVPEKETVFQLDPFHRNKAVREKIPYKKAQRDVFSFLRDGDIDGLFQYLEIYRDSLTDENETEFAEELIRYFEENRNGLLPYQEQSPDIPEKTEGRLYRNMGTMEGHIWSIIAKRMKHNHTSWSRRGANHLAKILAKKCEGKLDEVTAKIEAPCFDEELIEDEFVEVWSAAKAPKYDGKGYEYPVRGSIVAGASAIKGAPGALLRIAGMQI